MSRTISAHTLQQQLAQGTSLTLLDVRRKADYDADPNTIPGAQWRDPERMQEWGAQLPADREVVIYCARGGSVSNNVLDHLLSRQLKARFVEGGIAAWNALAKK